jgi:CheY-like chemotaxis protein
MNNFNAALIIDDDPVSNFISSEVIRRANLAKQIHIASDGGKALAFLIEYYDKNHVIPELLIVDLNMPIMDGYEFLEGFEKLFSGSKGNTKIIIVSNLFHKNDIKVLQEMGFTDFLDKPLSSAKLMAILEQKLLKVMSKSQS